jgi:hypothetical protein
MPTEPGDSWFSLKSVLALWQSNVLGVELLNGAARGNPSRPNQTPNTNICTARQSYRAKLIRRKGNNPDSQLRPLNLR